METTTETAAKRIVSFHIGRGGRFNNPGYKSFLGERKISEYTDELFLEYENIEKVVEKVQNNSILNKFEDEIINAITAGDFEKLEEFFIKKEDLGEMVYHDRGGNNTGLTESESDEGVGRIDIDMLYNTTYAKYLQDCDEEEMSLILNEETYIDSEIMDYCRQTLGIKNM
jgi:hypothetical protein